MTRRAGPRAGSVGHRMLLALAAVPKGFLPDRELLPLMSESNRTRWQITQYAQQLAGWNMAQRTKTGVQILPDGRYFCMDKSDLAPPAPAAPQKPAGLIASPRVARPFKPLDVAGLMRGGPQRDGMDDYRSVPSLMGGSRVFNGAHQS